MIIIKALFYCLAFSLRRLPILDYVVALQQPFLWSQKPTIAVLRAIPSYDSFHGFMYRFRMDDITSKKEQNRNNNNDDDKNLQQSHSKMITQPIDPAIRLPQGNAKAIKYWQRYFLPNLLQAEFGIDQRIQWTSHDDCQEVASQLLQQVLQCQPSKQCRNDVSSSITLLFNPQVSYIDPDAHQRLLMDLTNSLETFTTYCQEIFAPVHQCYQARIITSRGAPANVKCPMWHIDHVPIRWIQSLAGPGVVWVNQDGVQ
jgi:Protein of unknown function (DUF1826)